MSDRKIHSEGTYAHFVTFSCYNRRKLLTPDICKQVVIGTLSAQLSRQNGACAGFVIMLDHVHAMVWFPEEHQISAFLDKWKELSSREIQSIYKRKFPAYFSKLDPNEPVRQHKYYGFNIYSEKKLREKLEYMHNNPVSGGLVKNMIDWKWSSARFWHQGKSAGLRISWPH